MKRFLIFLLLATQCFGVVSIINSFNAGEMSPLLEGRTDISKYYSGCRTLENLYALSYGGAQRRPGTRFIAEAKNSSIACRLIPFEFSIEQAYIIEAGNLYFRFYFDSGQVQSGGSPFEISTPYTTSDLFELQFVQSADTMYIVHPDYTPYSLTRTDHDAWTLTAVDFERGPFKDENTTTTTITPSATTGSITLTASVALWNANHVGSHWQITHTLPTVNVSGTLANALDASASVDVQLGRTFDFSTHGTWTGTVILQRSYEDGAVDTWQDVRPVHYEDDGNITYTDTEPVADAVYRVFMEEGVAQTCNFNLTARSFNLNGVVEVTAFSSTTSVTATVENTLGGTDAVTTWSEGAWSDDEGWPAAIAFYEERLCFAATTNSPQTMWFSQTADWVNMLTGTNDSDAMIYTIAAEQVNVIRWMSPQNALLVGTVGGEWRVSSTSIEAPLTPTNVAVRRQSSYGSENIQPVMINNVILYVQRQGRKIRELVYSFQLDAWTSPDMTLLAEHITESGITEIAYQKTPDPTLWCVRNDGELAGLTYLRDEGVVGWHRQTTGTDNYESVAIIPGDGEDEVWVSVHRTVNGTTKRYIEQFQPREWDDQRDAFFVDSGLTFDGGAAITITGITQADPGVVSATAHGFSDGDQVRIADVTGMTEVNDNVYTVDSPGTNSFGLRDSTDSVAIDTSAFMAYVSGGDVEQQENTFTTLTHLESETVAVQGDGGFVSNEVVASGTITLDDFYNTVHAGLPYTSMLKPMKLELPSAGTIQGKVKRIHEITLRFHETLGCKVGDSWTNYDPVIFRDASDPLEAATPVFSGDKRAPFVGTFELDGNIFIQQDLPLPFTLIAIIPFFDVER